MSWRHGLAAGELLLERPTCKALLLALAHHANDYTCRCWPSVERLALFTGLSRRAVQGGLRELVELEMLAIHERPGKPNIYELTLPDCGPLDQGGARAAHPRKEGSAPPAQGGAPPAPEESGTDSDARVTNVFGENWRPAPPIVDRIKADEGLSDEEIERELKLFIVRNSETVVDKPNAAFRMWCARLKSLKHQPARIPAKGKGEPVEVVPLGIPDSPDPEIANLRLHLKHRMEPATYAGWFAPERVAFKLKGKSVEVIVSSLFHGDWIRNHLELPLQEALLSAALDGYMIRVSPPAKGEE
jgi:hypothetical protein